MKLSLTIEYESGIVRRAIKFVETTMQRIIVRQFAERAKKRGASGGVADD